MSKLDTAYKAAYVINTAVSYALTAAFAGAVAWAVLSGRNKAEKPETETRNTSSETANS